MRNFLLLLAVALLGISKTASAQTDIIIGTGTATNTNTTYPTPLQDYFEGSRAQYLYRASELTAAGMAPGNITAIKFNVLTLATDASGGGAFPIEQFRIRIGTTSVATLAAASWETVSTNVFGPVDYTATLGSNVFTFSSPFFWNGTDNIIIEICNGDPVNNTYVSWTGNHQVPWTTGLAFNGSHTTISDNNGNLCGTTTTTNSGTQTTRPNIIFSWVPATPCAGMPSGGTATGTPNPICLGQTITLGATGVTVASGLTYQWEVSTAGPGGPYSPIAGATTIGATTTQITTSWYRLKVTCTNTGDIAYSTEIQVVSPPAPGGTYTIGNGATSWTGGGASGTAGTGNFATFAEAVAAMSCGIAGPVVFNVVPNTYNEQVIIPAVPNASSSNTITFNGQNSTLTFNATLTGERAVIKLRGANYIRINNLNIVNTGATYGYGVQLVNNADSNIIANCEITVSTTATTTNFAGVVISGSETDAIGTGTTSALNDGNEFLTDTINGGYYGITNTATFAGGANGFNKFIGNDIRDFYAYGIYVAGTYNTVIEGNAIRRPTRTNTATTTSGIYLTTQSNTTTISRNRITNPYGAFAATTQSFYGIDFNNATASTGNDNMVVNNLIADISGNGTIYAINNSGSGNVTYFHNTISLDFIAATGGITRGFNQSGAASNIVFYNNNISITRGGSGLKHAIYLGTALLQTADYNNYYVNSTNGHVGFFGGNRTTLAAWQTATAASAHDVNSTSINPVFMDPPAGNYCIGNAAVNGTGFYVGVDFDIKNDVRSFTNPDVGAFECTPPPCGVPVGGTALVNPTSLCQNNPVILGMTIGPWGSGQTFQWQWSDDVTGSGGPYTDMGTPMLSADTVINADSTIWLRVKISCGAADVFTAPVLLTVSPAFPPGFYTIGGPTNTYVPGDPGGNFTTFQGAVNAMAACGITAGPVIFDVLPGTYNEQVIIPSIKGTSATDTIRFNGNGQTLSFNASLSNERAVIKLKDADHIIFDNLIIDASGGAFGYGVQLINNADSNTFSRCNIITSETSTSTGYVGVVINATDAGPIASGNTLCDGNRFDQNTITGGYYGFTVVGNAASPVENNRFTNNTVREFYSAGFYVAGTKTTLIESNIITRPTRPAFTTTYGVWATAVISEGLVISKNRIRNLSGGNPASTVAQYGINHNGIDPPVGSENIVSNNLVSDLGGQGLIYGLYNQNSDNTHYYHNTVSLDSATTLNPVTRGFSLTGLANGIAFKNNIITIKRGGTGLKHAIHVDNTTTDFTSNYNDFFVNATNAHVGFYNAANRTTLLAWQNASGEDANSLEIDPLYRDPATGDYRPSIATVDNLGTTATVVPITTDIMNVTRGTPPDMGAFEFSPVPCTSPPVPGTATVTPPSGICLQDPITLDVTGHSPLGTLTFQWEISATGAAGTWTDFGPLMYGPRFDTLTTVKTWYRARVTCGSVSSWTAPIQVTLNAILLGGTYTIGNGATNWVGQVGANFATFTEAVAAMNCGITDSVTFNVVPGTYNEQVRIGNIRNTNAINTVTFQSNTTVASSVNLTYNSAGANYTLKLDSASFFRFRNITITAQNPALGRVVEFSGTASYDSIIGCTIVAPTVAVSSNIAAGIYANQLKGFNNTLRGNTITGGSSGIYWFGTNGTTPTINHIIDNNTVSGAYTHGIYTSFQRNMDIRKNTVNMAGPLAATSYGIYAVDCDSVYDVVNNNVNITNSTTAAYGINLSNNDRAVVNGRGLIHGNTVIATGNTSSVWGMNISNATPGAATARHEVLNNVIAVNTTGTTAYGIYSNNVSYGTYYNNTVNNTSPNGTTTNAAARFENSSATDVVLRNNVFSHKAGGRALYVNNSNNFGMSDYNMLYTSGAVLVQRGTPAGSYANLAAWRTASNNDKWSIVYEPAFVSNNDPRPDLANPDVWAMHGRGVQITGNSFDINGAYRPQTLTEGVPDLGAYEFKPTAQPTLLTGTPAVPAANTTQVFMYGTDTVMKLAWKATNFPSSINIQRYSGVVPENPPPYPSGTDSMYFYNKVTVPGGASTTYEYDMNQFYIDPWQGSIPDQFMIGLGRRTPGNSWVVGFSSRVNVPKKEIYQVNMQTPMIEYTGFINPYAPPVLPDKDSSNRGRRFWVAYGHHQQMNNTTGGTQEMRLYLSAQQATNVQVKIYGTATPWVRNYSIPANTAIISDLIPKIGPDDAKITNEGLWNQGISITSEEPIEAYAHTYAATNSGASLLLPVGVWGYEYYSLNSSQYYASDCYSWVYVIADNDNTRVEITPSVLTRGGQPAGVPFQVTLNKGQLYMVMGTTSGATGSDITGTLIKSIPNTAGDCFPIGVFSGSSRTAICYNTNGDNYNQQVFPYSAWGKKYATFATANNTSATNYNSNIFRVMVKDPATTVTVNGTPITAAPWNATLIDNRYYQFGTPNGPGAGAAVYIEANQPVMVGQFMMSSGGNQCPGFTAPGDGDPEMMYISPIEQSINKAVFYTTIQNTINTNYINIVIPAAGLPSLKIDGVTPVFTHVFDHPALPGYKCVRHNLPATNAQHSVESDFPFTAITYGLGGAESYGYNTGTLVRTLNAKGSIDNWPPNTTGGPNDFTCLGTPFIFTAYLPVPATSLTWKFGSVANLTPGTDTTLTNPTPTGTTVINGVTYYVYQLATQYTFSATGIYPVQMVYSHPDIESCDHTATDVMYVQVVPAPKTNFSIAFSGCEGDVATFTGENTSASGAIPISAWEWTFHNSSTASGQNTTFTYTTPGTFNVNLHTVTPDGCIADSVKQVVVNPRPTASVVTDSIAVCSGDNAVFNIQSPLAGATYNWYTTATGGVPLTTGGNIVIGASGTTFTVQNVTAPAEYFVEGVSSAGCASLTRVRIKVDMKGALPAPVVTVGASTANSVTFNWTAVPGAVGYEVSVGGGAFVTPSSGATGTTHTVTGLSTLAQTCIVVRALGALACQNSVSASVCGCANSAPVVVTPIVSVCTGTNATFTIQSPAAGVTYNWYSAATGGTLLGTGSTFNSPTVTGTTNYYVEQVVTATGCVGAPRTQVTANILPPLVPPVIVSPVAPADITVNSIKFTWAAVPGAATYQVSVNGSATWITPSSGATGLTHTVTGLTPGQQACIKVRALGTIACQTSESAEVCDRAKSDLIFIPNTFSPNGDGKNEILSAYGWAIQTIQFMVFNQWGEKIHEVTTSAQGPSAGFTLWDGKTDGKVQPVGVYVYAAKITLKDGTVVNKSGALNIVR